MLLFAHRGASADAPENTLPAFAEAVRQKADGVELDAMVCGSGEVVVCHDEDLMRLCGTSAKVAELSAWRLARMDVGSRLGFPPAGIPTLAEVLDLLPKHMQVNIELKNDTLDDRGLSERVGEMVVQRGLESRVLLSSFNPLCLWRVAARFPSLRRGYLIDPDRNAFVHANVIAPLVSTYSVHPFHEACTVQRVAAYGALGLRVATWTVDDAAQALALSRRGVAICITNRPGALRAELASLGAA